MAFLAREAALQRTKLHPAARAGAVPSVLAPRAGHKGAGGTAGRDSGEEAEPESCVALSAADVYCTGWAEWEGGCLEWGPVPPAARPQGAGAGTGPALAVHSVWKAPECEAARHTCTHTHTHTPAHAPTHARTHNTHTGTWYTRWVPSPAPGLGLQRLPPS